MKKTIALFLSILMVALLLPLNAFALELKSVEETEVFEESGSYEKELPVFSTNVVDEGTCGKEGDNLKWSINSDNVLTISGTGAMEDFEYYYDSELYTSYTNAPWDGYKYSIWNIVIEEGVTTIGEYAFQDCCEVTGGITFPSSLEIIGDYAFVSSSISGELVIPDGVKYIGKSAFSGCEYLTGNINIPAGLTDIHSSSFYYCSNLKEYIVDTNNQYYSSVDGVLFTKDGKKVISAPTGKNGEFEIPEGTKIIGENAFVGSKLDTVVVPKSVTDVNYGAFWNFTKNVVFEGQPEYIGINTFGGWNASAKVYFMDGAPLSVDDYGEKSFSEDTEIFYLKGTESKWTFDSDGLWNGYEVKPFEFSSKVEFDPAEYVASGYCGAEPMGGKNIAWMLDSNGTLYIKGAGKMADYEQFWDEYTMKMLSSAPWFDYVSSIKELVFEDGITHIGNYAFYNTYNVSGGIDLPESLESIGRQAFENNGYSGNLVLPEKLKYIGEHAFNGCYKLSGIINIPKNVEEICNGAFAYASNVDGFTVDPENKYYSAKDGSLFSKDGKTLVFATYNLPEEYYIPEGTEVIETGAFYNHFGSYIIIPESVKLIKSSSFNNVEASIFFKGRTEEIEDFAFQMWGGSMEVYFMNGTPLEKTGDFPFGTSSDGWITMYYLKGTEDKVELDSYGEWKGFKLYTFELGEEVKFDPSKYIASGYCGKDPLGGKNMAWMIDKNGVLTIKGTGEMKNYSEIFVEGEGYVPSAPWFKYNDMITKLVIEEGVGSIGDFAFETLYSIEGEIVLPGTVKTIGEWAFYDCMNITGELVIPEGVEQIGHYAFYWCSGIIKVVIPSTVENISPGAFSGLVNCKEFVVSKSNPNYESVGGAVVSKDEKALIAFPSAETGTVYVPNGTEIIEADVFVGSMASEIVVPETVKTVRNYAFLNYYGKITFKGVVDTFEVYSIYVSGTGTVSVYFMGGAPKNVKENGYNGSFYEDDWGTINLYYLKETEDEWTFDSDGLWNGYEVIPFESSGKAEIAPGDYVDYGYCGSEPGGQNLAWTLDKNGTLTITGKGKMANYVDTLTEDEEVISSAPWGKYCKEIKNIVIEDGVESIGGNAFEYCAIEGKLVIPEGVKTIGGFAFYECKGITELELPASLETIVMGAFNYCTGMKKITVHEDNKSFSSVDGVLFNKDKKFLRMFPSGRTGKYSIPEGTEIIAMCAFVDPAVSEIVVPESIKRINTDSFVNVNGSIYIMGAPNQILEFAVENYEGKTKIYFMGGEPANVDDQAFFVSEDAEIEIFVNEETAESWNIDDDGIWKGFKVSLYNPNASKLGDCNGDGKISMADLLMLRKHLAGIKVEINLNAADCTGDGKTSMADLLMLRKHLAGIDVGL